MAVAVDFRPVNVPLWIVAGDDTGPVTLTVTDGGVPVDLTAGTVAARTTGQPGGVFTVTVAANVATLVLPRAESVKVADRARWDCQWTAADGTVTTLAGGYIRVLAQVTP